MQSLFLAYIRITVFFFKVYEYKTRHCGYFCLQQLYHNDHITRLTKEITEQLESTGKHFVIFILANVYQKVKF